MSDSNLLIEITDRNWNRLALTPNVLDEVSATEELGSANGEARVAILASDPAAAYLPDPESNEAQDVRFRVYDDGELVFAGHIDSRTIAVDELGGTITFGGKQRGIDLANHNVGRRDFLGWPLPDLFVELLRDNVARAPFATISASDEKDATPAVNAISGEPTQGSYWSIPYTGSRPVVFADVEDITVDLGSIKTINAVRVIPEWWSGKYYAFRTYYSTDGTTFTEIGDKDNNSPLSDKGIKYGGFDTPMRYIKVEFYQSADGYPRLAQVLAYQNIATVGGDTTYAVPFIENDDSGNVTLASGSGRVVQTGAFMGDGTLGNSFVTRLSGSGAAIRHTFRGTSEAVYFTQEAPATANVYLDDVLQETITIPSGYQQLGYSVTGLASGTHSVRIVRATGNPQIDYFSGEYQASYRKIQEDDPSIAYGGTWQTQYSDGFHSQAEKYTRTSGSDAAFEFWGDSFKLIGTKSTQRGIFEWFVDGVSQGNVDSYNASQLFQQTLITWSGTHAAHTVRIKHTGTKNASATDMIIGVDQVEGNWAHSIYLRSAQDTNLALLGRLSEMTNSFLRLNYTGSVDLLGSIGTDTGHIIRAGENEGGNIENAEVEAGFDEQFSAILALGRGSDNHSLRVFVQDKPTVERIGIKVGKLESRDISDAFLLVRQAWQTLQESKVPKRRYTVSWGGEETLLDLSVNAFPSTALALSPIAYWRLGERTGTTAVDESANSEDGTYVGSPTLGATGLLDGDTDTAVTFPGADTDYMQSPTLSALGTAYSLAAWITPSEEDSGILISGGGSRPYLRHLNHEISFVFTDSAGLQKSVATADDAALSGSTAFVVATHDGTTARIYINGAEAASSDIASQAPGALSFRVGRWGAGGIPFTGTVDEVAIFNSALTVQEVSDLYADGATATSVERSVPVVGTIEVGDTARLYAPEHGLTGDTYRLIERTRSWGEGGLTYTGRFANKRDRLGDMLTRATRDLSLTTDTPQGFRSVTQYGGNAENFTAETGGSTFRSAELDFFIDENTLILDAKLRMKIGKYRSYERDTTSGGGSTSGASSAASSAGGGNASVTSDAGSGHSHPVFDFVDDSPSATTEREYTSAGSGPGVIALKTSVGSFITTGVEDFGHDHDVTIPSHIHGIAHTHATPAHVHTQTYDIFEEGSFPGAVTVKLDDVDIDSLIGGPFTASDGDDTFDVSLTGALTSPGWHTLRFEAASGKGRITPYVIVKGLLL